MKIALLKNHSTNSNDTAELFKSVGMNSGNIVYWEAIIRLFNPEIISYGEFEKFAEYDAVIVTDLCWIREKMEYEYIEKYIDKYNIPFIPMSIGLQNNDYNPKFKLSEQLVRMLKKMQERAVLGVRGEYTASILRKYGITNIAVIGCPSMYYWNNRNLKIEDNNTPINICCNFRSFGEKLNTKELLILNYFADNKYMFVEQTPGVLERRNVKDEKNFQNLENYINDNLLLEFNYQIWAENLKAYNFSLGCRYHGNIISLQQNIKSLFITIDSRTQEMIDLFHLPYIKLEDFDEKKPIDYYYNIADYTQFNANYPKMFDAFTKFVLDNKLEINKDVEPLNFIAKKNVTKIKYNKTASNEENSIYLKVNKDKNIITYDVKLTGTWKECFKSGRKFSVEFDCNIEKVPDSIAILPILSVVLPVSWVEDATIYLNEIDNDFLECIDNVKRNYAFMLPKYKFAGKLKYVTAIKNCVDKSENKALCLFSGGVDATTTLLNNLDLKPIMLTIWGTDISLSDGDLWTKVKLQTKNIASDFDLPCTFVKTAFRYLLNEPYLTKKYQSWWHDFQHGIALLCQVAPYAYINNISNVMIASSYSSKDGVVNICASQEFIDENVKYAGCRIFHDSYYMSRMDKIRFISEYSKKYNKKFNLRVCWCQHAEMNCCVCEKCARTILGLYAVGADPNDFGFDITKEKENKLIENFKTGKIFLNDYFNELRDMFVKNKEHYKNNKLVQAFLDICKVKEEDLNDNFTETKIEKIASQNIEFFHKEKKNIIKDAFLENVGEGETVAWKLSHSKLSTFDVQHKILKCENNSPCWNILSQELNYTDLKGKELTLSVTSKSIKNSKLHLFARYKLKDGQIKYLAYCAVQNYDESTDYLTFIIPNDIPEGARLFIGVYLNEPETEVIVKEIELFV